MSAAPVRLFVAAWPPAEVAEQLAAVTRDAPGVRCLGSDRLHVTLRFLGTAAPDEVDEALSATSYPCAVARLDATTSRLGRDSLVVRVDGLDELASRVHAATDQFGRRSDHRFRGHISLARLRGESRRHVITKRLAAERFDVREVTLVCSTLTPHGSIYEVIRRYACVPH